MGSDRQRSVLLIGESPVARYAWSRSLVEQASNQFLPGDSEMGRHIGEDARKSSDLQRIVRGDRYMVLRS